jgi:hypothetical protein
MTKELSTSRTEEVELSSEEHGRSRISFPFIITHLSGMNDSQFLSEARLNDSQLLNEVRSCFMCGGPPRCALEALMRSMMDGNRLASFLSLIALEFDDSGIRVASFNSTGKWRARVVLLACEAHASVLFSISSANMGGKLDWSALVSSLLQSRQDVSLEAATSAADDERIVPSHMREYGPTHWNDFCNSCILNLIWMTPPAARQLHGQNCYARPCVGVSDRLWWRNRLNGASQEINREDLR